jgi:circadian clock protein KaiC
VRARGVKRLFVDGIDGFIKAAVPIQRMTYFFSALTNELRQLGVTAIYTCELHDLFPTEIALPLQGISSLIENIFLLRFAEHDARLMRTLTIVKTRDSGYDDTLREYRISSKGVELGGPLASNMSVTNVEPSAPVERPAPGQQRKRPSKRRGRKK